MSGSKHIGHKYPHAHTLAKRKQTQTPPVPAVHKPLAIGHFILKVIFLTHKYAKYMCFNLLATDKICTLSKKVILQKNSRRVPWKKTVGGDQFILAHLHSSLLDTHLTPGL